MTEQTGFDLREFLNGEAERPEAIDRRDFVKLLGASMALAGLSGCVRAPDERILPMVDAPANSTPGVPLHFATAMTIDGFATGVIARSYDGRPTKIEGNPDHPASLGGAGIFEQASVLELYDPRRAQFVRNGWQRSSWEALRAAFAPSVLSQRVGARGAGLALLLEPTASPLTALLVDRVRERYPDSRIQFHAPLANRAQYESTRRAYGAALLPQFDFRRADAIVSLGADPFGHGPFHLRYARDFSSRRREPVRALLHVAETCPSVTSTLADARIASSPTGITRLTVALFDEVMRLTGASRVGMRAKIIETSIELNDRERAFIATAAAALLANRAHSIVMADPLQSTEMQTLVHGMNAALGNVGNTVWYTNSPIAEAGTASHDLDSFMNNLPSLDTLVVLDGNICYSAPGDSEVLKKIRAVRQTLYVGSFSNETAQSATWHMPGTHYLEAWGIERAYDGTESIVQPLIAPMHNGRCVSELLALIAGMPQTSAHALAMYAFGIAHEADTNALWNEGLRRGVVSGTASPRFALPIVASAAGSARQAIGAAIIAADAKELPPAVRDTRNSAPSSVHSHRLEVSYTASSTIYDGRFADNPWLQELPDPITKLTWGNAALIAPITATGLNVSTGDVLRLESDTRVLEIPIIVVPGHAAGALSINMGYGRQGAEGIAHGVGVDINTFRTTGAPFHESGVLARSVRRKVALAITQTNSAIGERGATILGAGALGGTALGAGAPGTGGLGARNVPLTPLPKRRPLTLYEPKPAPANGFGADQWAMTIDLDQCTGCSACVVACQSENNIPVVGKADVGLGRVMHWLRVDRYVSGDDDAARVDVQPMLCQHCEKAPCEYVCPVNATVHSDDGLNEMVYNRCVGTRFCSNNCPYKVRRFNWFEYNGSVSPTERMQKNPEVSVRERGVMEKCTFCVQRIRQAQIDSQLKGEQYTGPVQTACQQTCPSQAIVFGSLTSPNSRVAELSNDARAFSALAELGTVPRVRYLARVAARGAGQT